MAVTHIAGATVQVGAQVRQRCSWCGAVLVDVNLERTAVPEGQDLRPATWLAGGLVAVDGNAPYVVSHTEGEQLPADACAQLDPEVTV